MPSSRDQEPVAVSPEERGRRLWRAAARVLVVQARERMGENTDTDRDEPAADWKNAKRAAVRSVMAAGAVEMVVAVRGAELLGAMDARRRGAPDFRFWAIQVGAPFELYRLREVPVSDAMALNDYGTRTTRLRTGRQAWALARRYAEAHPFKRVR